MLLYTFYLILLFLRRNMSDQSDRENIARLLSRLCNIRTEFARLVLAVETAGDFPNKTEDEKMALRKRRVEFLDKVISNDFTVNLFGEFEPQCLAVKHNVPIQMASMVINAERDEEILEHEKSSLRDERMNFLQTVLIFLLT